MSNNRKFRHEYKFLCSNQEMVVLEHRVKTLLALDQNALTKGFYHIRSVYFDDYHRTCVKRNEDGTDQRVKYRIRTYNVAQDKIVLEKKEKVHGMTRKFQCELSKEQAGTLLLGNILSMEKSEFDLYPQVLKELLVLMKTRGLKPCMIVSYDRIPYIYKEGNVRITFDQNIAASTRIEDFFEESLEVRPILPLNQQLMELKYDEYLPQTIKKVLEIGRLRQMTFSKFYLCSRLKDPYGIMVRK